MDQWKGYESSEILTKLPHAALRTGNAHQDIKKSEEICGSHEKSQVWPRTVSLPSSGPGKRPKNLRNFHCGLQWLCVTRARHDDWLARLLAASLSEEVDRVLSNSQSDFISTPCRRLCIPSLWNRHFSFWRLAITRTLCRSLSPTWPLASPSSSFSAQPMSRLVCFGFDVIL